MLRPLLDRVLLEKVEEEKVTKSGIILSDKTVEKPSTAKVVAVGPGKLNDQGTEYVIVEMKDILAVVE